MITSVSLKNFRGFSEHKIRFKGRTVVVGKNNAGKSTLVEALRIISLVLDRVPTATVRSPPSWADAPLAHKGIKPSTENIGVQKEALFHRYGNPPAIIDATFASDVSVRIYVGPDVDIHAVFFNSSRKVCLSAAEIKSLTLPSVKILLQIGPLREDEAMLREEYVRQSVSSVRASLHFRNQIFYSPGKKASLNQILEETWPGVVVSAVERQKVERDEILRLIVRDTDFSSEVAWMGSGLQMWLQMAWFLARYGDSDCLIFDEPDVYMHADVQRRLVRLLHTKDRSAQIIIATHSPEIISEFEPDSVLLVDKSRDTSHYAADSSAAQAVLSALGSVHSLGFSRLATYGCILFVEGDDVQNLKRMQNVLDAYSRVPVDVIPAMSLGSWSALSSAVGVGLMMRELKVSGVGGLVIVDRDYRTDGVVDEQRRCVERAGLKFHVWKRKEIENYFIIPDAIARCVSDFTRTRVESAVIQGLVKKLCDAMKDDLLAALTDEIWKEDRARGPGSASVQAKKIIEANWSSGTEHHVVSGKTLLSRLFQELNSEYKINLSIGKIAEFIHSDELDQEVHHLFGTINAMLKRSEG